MDKRKSMIILSCVSLIAILGVAFLATQNQNPSTKEETDNTEIVAPNNFDDNNPPANFTLPEGDLNFTMPNGRFNGTIPDGSSDFMPPPNRSRNSTLPLMENLTDDQNAILNETMEELRESGATQGEIMATVQKLMEEWGIQNTIE